MTAPSDHSNRGHGRPRPSQPHSRGLGILPMIYDVHRQDAEATIPPRGTGVRPVTTKNHWFRNRGTSATHPTLPA
jgi:hypothetical protein